MIFLLDMKVRLSSCNYNDNFDDTYLVVCHLYHLDNDQMAPIGMREYAQLTVVLEYEHFDACSEVLYDFPEFQNLKTRNSYVPINAIIASKRHVFLSDGTQSFCQ